ncbi:MAG: hypothetical protein BWY69_00592 [Planctomycetes bacterium ADurb.Bin401]|nr:MAG: hypothetical protein BWY69_00592 [Planctomycetes bacterium ADurb.Bin401]
MLSKSHEANLPSSITSQDDEPKSPGNPFKESFQPGLPASISSPRPVKSNEIALIATKAHSFAKIVTGGNTALSFFTPVSVTALSWSGPKRFMKYLFFLGAT